MPRNLPLYHTLATRADAGALRFHMPGHKGKAIPESALAGACALDFTELYGTGNLYDGVFPIADAEALCARAWGVPQAFFLTGGATMGNFAMLSLVRQETAHILVDRGSHKSVYHALGLLDFSPEYLMPETIAPFGVAAPHAPENIDRILTQKPEIGAVILTSPTYYGVCSDIAAIAQVCRRHHARLLVDEAHGAHFPFLSDMPCAVRQGAALATCSMHKTLPALGQSALLLAGAEFPAYAVRRATALFGTSSPSYQVMASMDLARDFMEHEGRAICARHAETLRAIREEIRARGSFLPLCIDGGDPLRLCVMTSCAGLSGYRAAQLLEERHHIVCEMADERQVLFIITAADTTEELQKLSRALHALEQERGAPIVPQCAPPKPACVRYSLHDALCMPAEQIALCDAPGRAAASHLCPYPPGIPVVAVGEVIEKDHLEYLYHNGFAQDDPVLVIRES